MNADLISSGRAALSVSWPSQFDSQTLTRETVQKMRGWMERRSSHPVVVHCAIQARRLAMGAGRQAVAGAVWRFLRSSLGFVNDEEIAPALGYPEAAEVLIDPALLLSSSTPQGDCDDYTMAAGAMLLALRIPVEIVTIKADRKDPSRWSHVYLDAILENGSHFTLDASHGRYPGWEAPDYYERRGWGVIAPPEKVQTLNGYEARRGLDRYGLGQDESSVPWWQTAIYTGLDIARANLIPRGSASARIGQSNVQLSLPDFQRPGSIPTGWIVGGALGIVGLLLLTRGGGR